MRRFLFRRPLPRRLFRRVAGPAFRFCFEHRETAFDRQARRPFEAVSVRAFAHDSGRRFAVRCASVSALSLCALALCWHCTFAALRLPCRACVALSLLRLRRALAFGARVQSTA
jgi:hypothetical protein